jgi:predicted lipoprotein with Yx(FWY)xxD motif
MMKQLFASAILALALSACGGGGSSRAGGYGGPPAPGPTNPPVAQPLSTMTLKGSAGFVNSASHTVYVFDADLGTPNASTCSGACALNWPPVTTTAGATLPTPWSMFARGDGSTQLAYKTRALYTFSADANAGDVFGDGINAFGGVWHIARP